MENKMLYKSVCTARNLDKDGDPCENHTVTDTEGREIHFVKFPSLPRSATLDKYFSELPGEKGFRTKTNPSQFWDGGNTVTTEAVVSDKQDAIDKAKQARKDAEDAYRALKPVRRRSK